MVLWINICLTSVRTRVQILRSRICNPSIRRYRITLSVFPQEVLNRSLITPDRVLTTDHRNPFTQVYLSETMSSLGFLTGVWVREGSFRGTWVRGFS